MGEDIVDIVIDSIKANDESKQFNINTVNLPNLDHVKEDEENDEYKDDEIDLPDLSTIIQGHHSKQESGDLSRYINNIGSGLFHNVHLKPTSLKRSHSDPDIRVRDKIWDELLSAFKH